MHTHAGDSNHPSSTLSKQTGAASPGLLPLSQSALTVSPVALSSHARRRPPPCAALLCRFLLSHPVPVVLGPNGRHYLIDHHHLARAMHEKGIQTCYAGVWRLQGAVVDRNMPRCLPSPRLSVYRKSGVPPFRVPEIELTCRLQYTSVLLPLLCRRCC